MVCVCDGGGRRLRSFSRDSMPEKRRRRGDRVRVRARSQHASLSRKTERIKRKEAEKGITTWEEEERHLGIGRKSEGKSFSFLPPLPNTLHAAGFSPSLFLGGGDGGHSATSFPSVSRAIHARRERRTNMMDGKVETKEFLLLSRPRRQVKEYFYVHFRFVEVTNSRQ